jgi:NAD(P)-dependent dehydrogenase (short-subunit alcohol dehydrogenase family)
MSNNPFSLENKTILITGASSGIGKATAVQCSKMGAKLIVTGRNLERLKETYNELEGDNHLMIQADLSNVDDLESLINSIEKIDGIVHSAGILETTPFSFTSNIKLSETMKINFEIPFILTQKLIKSKKIKNNSSVVFVSSLSGYLTGAVGLSAYSASKGAICATVRVIALELAPKKIRVNSVCPGMVKTEMNSGNSKLFKEQLTEDELRNYPLGYGTVEDIAKTNIFLLSDASKWITGTNLVIDGGASIH